jgi:hypothetical protein
MNVYCIFHVTREDIVESTVSRLPAGQRNRGSMAGRCKRFISSPKRPPPALQPTDTPHQTVPGVSVPGRDFNHSPSRSAEVKNEFP